MHEVDSIMPRDLGVFLIATACLPAIACDDGTGDDADVVDADAALYEDDEPTAPGALMQAQMAHFFATGEIAAP
jgi:hypothetical protein